MVVDTGPLVAAANRRDKAHFLAAALIAELGSEAVVPVPVLAETDHLLRTHVGVHAARLFLRSAADGAMTIDYLTPALLRRATELDETFADLDVGLTDSCVMAVAERHNLPILTFDFEDFRATKPARGFWRLIVDEGRYHDAISNA
ncbi:MAG: type II toxin-antitoxin system VapC family toxin [Actinomycetota bacterium]